MNRVISGELEKSTGSLLIDGFGDVAILSLVHVEQTLLHAACCITVWVTMAVINSLLEDTLVPTINKVSMVSIPSRVTVRVHKWLSRIHGLASHAIEVV